MKVSGILLVLGMATAAQAQFQVPVEEPTPRPAYGGYYRGPQGQVVPARQVPIQRRSNYTYMGSTTRYGQPSLIDRSRLVDGSRPHHYDPRRGLIYDDVRRPRGR